MTLFPEVRVLNHSTTDTDTEEEENAAPVAQPHGYFTDEERYMAGVRRAVMGLPEPESDPETEPEDYGPEMEGHYDIMVRSWLIRAAILTILTAIAVSVAISTSRIDNNNHPTSTSTTTEKDMTTTGEQTTTTAENIMTTTREPSTATIVTITNSTSIETEGRLSLGFNPNF